MAVSGERKRVRLTAGLDLALACHRHEVSAPERRSLAQVGPAGLVRLIRRGRTGESIHLIVSTNCL